MPATTWIEIADTAVKIAAGDVVAAAGAYLVEVYRRKQDRLREQEERHRENLEKPVLAFVDELLTLISRAYWNKADGKDPGVAELLEAFRAKEAMVEARLDAIGNHAFSAAFDTLDSSFVAFRGALADGSLVKAREHMKEAHRHAAALFRVVHGVRRRSER